MSEINGAALRVYRPTPVETQWVFPWAEDGSTIVLAIPPDDIERWKLRSIVKKPRAVAIHADWLEDGRYQKLRDCARRDGQALEHVLMCIALVMFELINNKTAVGLGKIGTRYDEMALNHWHLSEASGPMFAYAVRCAMSVGILVKVDAADENAARIYRPAPTREYEKNDPENRAHGARTRAHDVRAACASTGPDRTGRDLTRTDPTRSDAVGSGVVEKEQRSESARPDGMQVVTVEGKSLDVGDHATAMSWIEALCHRWRKVANRTDYPASADDIRDLSRAFAAARDAGQAAEFFRALKLWCEQMDHGGGIHHKFVTVGWLKPVHRK